MFRGYGVPYQFSAKDLVWPGKKAPGQMPSTFGRELNRVVSRSPQPKVGIWDFGSTRRTINTGMAKSIHRLMHNRLNGFMIACTCHVDPPLLISHH